MCNAVASDTPLKRYKRNWPIAFDLSIFVLVLRVAFLVCRVYLTFIIVMNVHVYVSGPQN